MGENLEETLLVFLVGFEMKLWPGLRLPVFNHVHAVGCDGRLMSRRQTINILEKSAGVIDPLKLGHQEVGDSTLVDPVRHLRQYQDRPRIRGEQKTLARRVVVVERPRTETIPGTKKFPVPLIPDPEREITPKPVYTFFSPLELGEEDQLGSPYRLASVGQAKRCK